MRSPLRPGPPLVEPPAPWWTARVEELSEPELRLLAYATGEHVPVEVRFDLEQPERERFQLLAERGKPTVS